MGSLPSSNIRSPKDLKDKKIGFYSDTSGTKLNLLAVLRQARLAAKDVKTIETDALNFATLIHDQVDATSSTVPALVSAQAKGLGEVNALQVKDYFSYSGDLFVVTEETYAQRKKQLHAFLAGYETSVR